jgi:hypothetical protein
MVFNPAGLAPSFHHFRDFAMVSVSVANPGLFLMNAM